MLAGPSEPAINLQKACRTTAFTEMPVGIGSFMEQNLTTERALFHWKIRLEKSKRQEFCIQIF